MSLSNGASDLRTPAVLVDLDILENNLKHYQALSNKVNKKLIPMIKTHKSSTLAKKQINRGVREFLVGTVDEAVQISKLKTDVIVAYPFLGEKNLNLIYDCTKSVFITLSLDSLEVAKYYNDFFREKKILMSYVVIIDTGLNRFGVLPEEVPSTVNFIETNFKSLNFRGITTHLGHIYQEENPDRVITVAKAIHKMMNDAVETLKENDLEPQLVATGSTPTFKEDSKADVYNALRPGNYVFNDMIQVSLGIASLEDCALTVLTTIIAKKNNNTLIVDCGSKTLGLDKGAHGNKSINGFGYVVGHPELEIVSLSEEVGVIKSKSTTSLSIGDRVEIIPNHSCKTCNMSSYLVGVRNSSIEELIKIDMRGNSQKPY